MTPCFPSLPPSVCPSACFLCSFCSAQTMKPETNLPPPLPPLALTCGSSGRTGGRTYTPFSAASHRGSPPKVSSSLAISLPLKMSTSLEGSAHSSCGTISGHRGVGGVCVGGGGEGFKVGHCVNYATRLTHTKLLCQTAGETHKGGAAGGRGKQPSRGGGGRAGRSEARIHVSPNTFESRRPTVHAPSPPYTHTYPFPSPSTTDTMQTAAPSLSPPPPPPPHTHPPPGT